MESSPPPTGPHTSRAQTLTAGRPARPSHAARPARTVYAAGTGSHRAGGARPGSGSGEPLPGLSPLKALTGVLLLLPFLLLPLAVLWFAGRPVLVEHSRLARYREVGAVVVRTDIERRAPATTGGAASFVPRVTFRYAVGEGVYESGRVTPLDVGGTERWARKHIEEYRPGDAVTAFYDPGSPGRAFLERPATGVLTATFFLPVPLLAVALLWASRVRHRQQRAAGGPLHLVR